MLSELKNIAIASETEFIIVDDTNENELPTQSRVRIPLTMWIDYGGFSPNPPAITLLINPQTMTTSLTKRINSSFTRGGFVVEQWGDNLDVLKFSGSIGAYYVVAESEAGTGLNRYDRNKSYSFRNLMELFLVYRNNGAIYLNSTKNIDNNQNAQQNKLFKNTTSTFTSNNNTRVPNSLKTAKTRISKMGLVYLQYDKTLYQGSFNSFSIEEDAMRPYNLSYSFEFTVLLRRTVDHRKNATYNQVAYDFSDKPMAIDLINNIQGYFVDVQKTNAELEAETNPNIFEQRESTQNYPAAMLNYTNKLLSQKGYSANPTQQSLILHNFDELQKTHDYKGIQIISESIYQQMYEIVSQKVTDPNETPKTPEELAQEARNLTNNMLNMSNLKKTQGVGNV